MNDYSNGDYQVVISLAQILFGENCLFYMRSKNKFYDGRSASVSGEIVVRKVDPEDD